MPDQGNRSIVFINQATGYLTIDIINAFANSNEFSNVALVAGSIRVQDIPLSQRVHWSKIALYNRGNPQKKFFSWLLGTFQIGWLLLTRYRKYEVFYITIPPFAYLLSLLFSNRFSILVFDVYPNVLQIYNISPRNILYRLWVIANKNLFKRAHCVYTIGEGMVKLLEQYTNRENLTIIHNWSGLTQVREIAREQNPFIQQHQLENKFIVQYSGNIGYTHNVEVVVELAEALQQEADIFVLIIGRGEKFNTIKQLVESKGLINCKLLPFQPDNLLNYTLSAADLGVVLLDDKTAHVSIPSKIYNLQAVGVPLLGIAAADSELAYHVSKHQNGKCFAPKEKNSILEFIKSVKEDTKMLKQYRDNSKRAAVEYTMKNSELYLKTYVQKGR